MMSKESRGISVFVGHADKPQMAWWERSKFQKKFRRGKLIEEVVYEVNDKSVSVYNFSKEKLSDEHLDQIKFVMENIAQIQKGKVFDDVPYVVLHDDDLDKSGGGFYTVALAHTSPAEGKKYVELSSTFFDEKIPEEDGDGDYPILVPILMHEWSHFLDKKDVELKGKSPNSYARTDRRENFAESHTIFWLNPGFLDQERRDCLTDNFMDPKYLPIDGKPKVVFERRTGDKIILPEEARKFLLS